MLLGGCVLRAKALDQGNLRAPNHEVGAEIQASQRCLVPRNRTPHRAQTTLSITQPTR